MRKILLNTLFAFAVGVGAAQAAEVVVRVAPPRAVVEHRDVRPSPHHVWIAGYQRWDGHRYVWERGRWEVPPHAHAKWIAPKWSHRHDGYVFSQGHWS